MNFKNTFYVIFIISITMATKCETGRGFNKLKEFYAKKLNIPTKELFDFYCLAESLFKPKMTEDEKLVMKNLFSFHDPVHRERKEEREESRREEKSPEKQQKSAFIKYARETWGIID